MWTLSFDTTTDVFIPQLIRTVVRVNVSTAISSLISGGFALF